MKRSRGRVPGNFLQAEFIFRILIMSIKFCIVRAARECDMSYCA